MPIEIDGARGAIAGTLFWTPPPGGGLPLGAIFVLAGLVIACCIAVAVVRHRRRVAAADAGAGAGGGLVIRRLSLLLALAWLLAAVAARRPARTRCWSRRRPSAARRWRAAPRQVVLRFNEPVEVQFGAVRVYDAAGEEVQEGAAFHPGRDDRAVAVRLRGGPADGGYTATYRVVSADAHPVSGGFVFGVGKDGAASPVTVGELLDGQDSGPVTSVAFAAVRALQFAAIALALGALAVLVLVWLPALAALRVPAGGWRSASDAFAARWRRAAARRGAVGPALGRCSRCRCRPRRRRARRSGRHRRRRATCSTRASGRSGASERSPGPSCSGSASPAARRCRRSGPPRSARPASRCRARAAGPPCSRCRCCGSPACRRSAGTPACRSRSRCCCPANVLHVIAASAWIGGIAVLVLALPAATRRLEPADRTRLLAGAIGRFSTLALVSVAALLTGGIVQSLLELGAVDDLLDTAYGRAILVKSALVARPARRRRPQPPAHASRAGARGARRRGRPGGRERRCAARCAPRSRSASPRSP